MEDVECFHHQPPLSLGYPPKPRLGLCPCHQLSDRRWHICGDTGGGRGDAVEPRLSWSYSSNPFIFFL